MSYQALDLMMEPMSQAGDMKTVNKRRLVSLHPERKSGHAGSLDPMAEGVLVLCFGRATKLVELWMNQPKVCWWFKTCKLVQAWPAEGTYTKARQMPVTNCRIITVKLALPNT